MSARRRRHVRTEPSASWTDVGVNAGYPRKVVLRRLERLEQQGLLECGVSVDTAWITTAGEAHLKASETVRQTFRQASEEDESASKSMIAVELIGVEPTAF